MKHDVGVVIGRFQPYHNEHEALLNAAMKGAEKIIFVLCSARSSRSARNPFTAAERRNLIEANLPDKTRNRVAFLEVRDYFYDNKAWVNEIVEKVKCQSTGRTALYVCTKDVSTSYSKLFHGWDFIDVATPAKDSGEALRERFLRDGQLSGEVSEATRTWLERFASESPAYGLLRDEQKAIDKYKKDWASAPYPPVFVTTDAALVQAGHILLIRRKESPGKDLWALPGGFLDQNELLEDCALRELFEETAIDMDPDEIRRALFQVKTFDHPLRSQRGRTITHAHHFKLAGDRLASIKGSDDAAEAKWVPLLDLGSMEHEFFEDHFHMIQSLIAP